MREETTFLPPRTSTHILGRNHHPADLVLQPEGRHAAFQALLHLLLKSRIGVDDVPLLFHVQRDTSVRKKFDDALDEPAHAAIHAKEKDPEKRDRDDHHPGGHKHFVPRRPGDLAHLDAHLVQKTAPPAGDAPRGARKSPASLVVSRAPLYHRSSIFPPASPSLAALSALNPFLAACCVRIRHRPAKVAGEEGFEPPLSVLETDGLPLNLLPYQTRSYFTSL